jgi:hypothetical protein
MQLIVAVEMMEETGLKRGHLVGRRTANNCRGMPDHWGARYHGRKLVKVANKLHG